MSKLKITNARRKQRVRLSLRRTASGRPRLSIFRSSKHIYAQVIDDAQAVTVASASTNEKDGKEAKSWNVGAASSVGKKIAERSIAKGVKQVMFDRGGYIYHGRIKALAERKQHRTDNSAPKPSASPAKLNPAITAAVRAFSSTSASLEVMARWCGRIRSSRM